MNVFFGLCLLLFGVWFWPWLIDSVLYPVLHGGPTWLILSSLSTVTILISFNILLCVGAFASDDY